MTKLDFSALNKNAADSYHQQRNLIKKVCKGELINCQHCQLIISLIPAQDGIAFIRCNKGCTNIELELG